MSTRPCSTWRRSRPVLLTGSSTIPHAVRLWFAGLITYSEALTLVYICTDIGGAVLRMLAATRGDVSGADGAAADQDAAPSCRSPAPVCVTTASGSRLTRRAGSLRAAAGRAGVIDVFEHRSRRRNRGAVRHPRPITVAAALAAIPGTVLPDREPRLGHDGAGAAGWQAALILREGSAPLDVSSQHVGRISRCDPAVADQQGARRRRLPGLVRLVERTCAALAHCPRSPGPLGKGSPENPRFPSTLTAALPPSRKSAEAGAANS